MNKAFVREAEDIGPRCPGCDSIGIEVLRETLDAHIPAALRGTITESAWYCPFDRCQIVYFDAFDRNLRTDQVPVPVYPKDPHAPLCACFGLSTADIDRDLAEGSVERTRECIRQAHTAEAACVTRSPSGQSCVAEVQRYYMRRRGG